ncbi:hypothetical protein, partial [Saccharothrix sp. CCNWLY140-2]|uniref:hypothetical protein n=1 Tax=Saccharothrix sp. CCNWLY140-2 TaxID=3138500 RepID=UPI003216F0A5
YGDDTSKKPKLSCVLPGGLPLAGSAAALRAKDRMVMPMGESGPRQRMGDVDGARAGVGRRGVWAGRAALAGRAGGPCGVWAGRVWASGR